MESGLLGVFSINPATMARLVSIVYTICTHFYHSTKSCRCIVSVLLLLLTFWLLIVPSSQTHNRGSKVFAFSDLGRGPEDYVSFFYTWLLSFFQVSGLSI